MQTYDTIRAFREARQRLRGRVGLVPTMGALHAGHMALVNQALAGCDHVIATIFVNPTQFGPDEDLDSYPRQLKADLEALAVAGVDLVFTPSAAAMYPFGFQTFVAVEQVTQGLEGAHRPGHFRGVATVVTKLLNITQPDCAYFGQKDAQQVVVLRQMVKDLNIPVEVIPVPTVREPDGLALSSRNAYLSEDERRAATVLSRALQAAASQVDAGERDPNLLRNVMQGVVSVEPLAKVDYISVADAATLQELETPPPAGSVMLASLAVQVGKPRLLDNMLLPENLNTMAGLSAHLGTS